MDETSRLPLPDRDFALDEVLRDFGASLRPDGPDDEIDEWDFYDESFRRLVRWAEECGRFHEGLEALKEGGREHDLTYDPLSATWLKFTKPAKAGYVVSFALGAPALEPANPLEYLERILLQNQIFNDRVSFVGIGGSRIYPTIITRQLHIAGEPAEPAEIIRMMTEELGFQELPSALSVGYEDSLAFVREEIAVFDLRPANVVKIAQGFVIPIDSIPARLDDEAVAILARYSLTRSSTRPST